MKVIVNSLPKSGTHLLEKALKILDLRSAHEDRSITRKITDRMGFTSPAFLEHEAMTRWGRYRRQGDRSRPSNCHPLPIGVFAPYYVSEAELQAMLAGYSPQTFLKAHLPYDARVASVFDNLGIRNITILRDPRGVVASMVPFILETKTLDHFLRPLFERMTPDERVGYIVNGGFADPPGIELLSLAQAYQDVLDWNRHPGTLVVRFEDLVGPHGGGSAEALQATLGKIADHIGARITPPIRERMTDVFDPSAPTFRGGRIDGWRERLSPSQISAIEEGLGDELFSLAGYDRG